MERAMDPTNCRLEDSVLLAGWPTSTCQDMEEAGGQGSIAAGNRGHTLHSAAALTGPKVSGGPAATENSGAFPPGGWTTPQCHDTNPRGAGNRENPAAGNACLGWDAQMAGWGTPKVSAGKYCSNLDNPDDPFLTLEGEADLAGFPTTRVSDMNGNQAHGDGGQALNALADTFMTPDMTGWKLNPAFSLWLMGYPEAWLWNAPRQEKRGRSTAAPPSSEPETPSCPNSPPAL